MTEKLLPCPFCGGISIADLYARDGRVIGCSDCQAKITVFNPTTPSQTAAKWNTRRGLAPTPRQSPARFMALIEAEAKRRCVQDAEISLDYLACQDRRFRHDDLRPWWQAKFVYRIESEIERLEAAGFVVSPSTAMTGSAEAVADQIDDMVAAWLEEDQDAVCDGAPRKYEGAFRQDCQRLIAAALAAPAQSDARTVEPGDAVRELAHRLWSVHPREIQDLGITREEFYAREIMKLLATRSSPAPAAKPFLYADISADGEVRATSMARQAGLEPLYRGAAPAATRLDAIHAFQEAHDRVSPKEPHHAMMAGLDAVLDLLVSRNDRGGGVS